MFTAQSAGCIVFQSAACFVQSASCIVDQSTGCSLISWLRCSSAQWLGFSQMNALQLSQLVVVQSNGCIAILSTGCIAVHSADCTMVYLGKWQSGNELQEQHLKIFSLKVAWLSIIGKYVSMKRSEHNVLSSWAGRPLPKFSLSLGSVSPLSCRLGSSVVASPHLYNSQITIISTDIIVSSASLTTTVDLVVLL